MPPLGARRGGGLVAALDRVPLAARTAVFAVAVAVLTVALLLPRVSTPQVVVRMDLLEHALGFALLTALGRWRWGRPTLLLGGVVTYAALTELVQGLFLPGRSGDPLDLLVDVLGALAAWLLLASRPDVSPAAAVAAPVDPARPADPAER